MWFSSDKQWQEVDGWWPSLFRSDRSGQIGISSEVKMDRRAETLMQRNVQRVSYWPSPSSSSEKIPPPVSVKQKTSTQSEQPARLIPTRSGPGSLCLSATDLLLPRGVQCGDLTLDVGNLQRTTH